jgi:hypothetical protein
LVERRGPIFLALAAGPGLEIAPGRELQKHRQMNELNNQKSWNFY